MARLHSKGRYIPHARLEHEPEPGGQAGLSIGELLHYSGEVRQYCRNFFLAMAHCDFAPIQLAN